MKKLAFLLFYLVVLSGISSAKSDPDFLKYLGDQWVDSLMKKLTLDQKIGQLFMVQAYSNGKTIKPEDVLKQIEQYQVGGIIFMQGSPYEQAKICNQFQKVSQIPLLVAIDAETGLGFRLDSTLNYPVQMALGAILDDTLIYQMGYEIGKQCRLVGVHMNMAPVCDINVNPQNPVINFRSFGENRNEVARKAWLYAKGMQDAGVIATAKHFPGHGDTQVDSHYDLPVLDQPKERLDSLELFPFTYLIDKGIFAVMTGHLQVPALEPDPKIPASLSSKLLINKLKDDLAFDGLVITDAMNMKGVSNLYSSAESSVKALKAGNDMIEIVPRLDRAIAAVRLAVANGEITPDEIDEKCRKILSLKKWLGLDKKKTVTEDNLDQKLNSNKFLLTKRKLQEKALTVLLNRDSIIPLKNLDTLKIASLMIGANQISSFQKMLGNYTEVDHFSISKNATNEEIADLLNQLEPYNQIIVGLNKMSLYPYRRFGITTQQISLIENLKDKHPVICFFGNPYALTHFPSISAAGSLIVGYQDDDETEELAAQLIFGAIGANGKLPVRVSDLFPINSGLEIRPIQRLKYSIPEEVNIDSDFLNRKIDSLANLGIQEKAFPGCQVLIARNGTVILEKSYGFFTYDNIDSVRNDDLYDLASVTKVTAALPAVMKLYDEKRINLDKPFAEYFTEFKNSNKSAMTFRDVLTHQGRLQSFIPFWLEPGSSSKLRAGAFQDKPTDDFQVRVSSNLYVKNDFKNQIVQDIIKSPLWVRKEFHYSDLGFSLIPDVTERLTKKQFTDFMNNEFYKPLGASTTGFNPYEHFPLEYIVPTENDQTFRKELVHGFVHDELAALRGGVSGNAGLFSSANDLAKVMQMYLQLGWYGGKQYISGSTIVEFTKLQFPHSNSHRSLGFDKPNPGIAGLKNKFPAVDASPQSYGHTGFTGTIVWNDPENQLMFIFLSNRVYPTRRNFGITQLNIRVQMHQAIYDAIKKGLN
ncbi:MAG: glycoside hydrolase family 3 N-terminal domain-containing protein [Prolixibacteraceae bacterium]|jgi:beta-glucosidase-like glycosyl hydrolase/CubicO group peptidase (beta-lactamase class C family)